MPRNVGLLCSTASGNQNVLRGIAYFRAIDLSHLHFVGTNYSPFAFVQFHSSVGQQPLVNISQPQYLIGLQIGELKMVD